MQYINNGLRAFARGAAVIGALAMAAPVYAQEIPYANVPEGTYRTRIARCFVSNDSKENEPKIRVICDTKTLTTTTLNGRLLHYAFQNPDAPIGAFIIRVEEGIESVHLKASREGRRVGSESAEARAMKYIHDLLAKDVIKRENKVQ